MPRKAIFSLGLGALNPKTLIRGWSIPVKGRQALVSNVIMANIPQLILSLIYFAYNSLFTTMSLATEWSQFGNTRKGLRISSKPQGEQRSTYFLQLPYRFAIPLMVTSGLLHWLVSQSIFIVLVDDISLMDDASQNNSFIACGYSPIAMLLVIIVGALLVISLVAIGRMPLKSAMPVAASCSAAISAACHSDGEDNDNAAFQKLKWGATAVVKKRGDVGHCTFLNGDIVPPKSGVLYGGGRFKQIEPLKLNLP
jgi:hypothetical protein